MTSHLLINENPLMVIPSLAIKLGLNEAIILQQIHYWLNASKKEYDGRRWTYNTYQEWQKQFPFWSIATIRRAINKLEAEGILISGNFNKLKIDRTKWYTIDYEKLNESSENDDMLTMSSPCDQIAHMENSSCTHGEVNLSRPLPKISSKTSTKTSTKEKNIVEKLDHSSYGREIYHEVIRYLNSKTGAKYRPSTKKTRDCITARLNEGFGIEDFKKVIDTKVKQWLDDPYFYRYLRPETLFGNKFEGYLNEKKDCVVLASGQIISSDWKTTSIDDLPF